jgi:tryptophan halogenase
MLNGWCWNIPLRDSDHRGYVYCSDFCSEEEALNEMKKRNPSMGEHRLIRFKTGRHEHFVKANVAAIGNSYGFVEPLESTGIHMIIKEVQMLRDNFEMLSKDSTNTLRDLLNRDMNNKWDYLRWFLAIHYKFNKKYESNFWKECRQNVDTSGLDPVVDIYKELGLLSYLPEKIQGSLKKQIDDHLFGFLGIDNILLGQGVLPKKIDKLKAVNQALWQYNVSNWNKLTNASVDLKEDIEILTNNPALL